MDSVQLHTPLTVIPWAGPSSDHATTDGQTGQRTQQFYRLGCVERFTLRVSCCEKIHVKGNGIGNEHPEAQSCVSLICPPPEKCDSMRSLIN